jgi:CMP-N,N'-diacetyllegionaminic acid synthase
VKTSTKVLAIIPARSGSKRLPEKNVRLLCGKPLLFWTIEAALQSECIDEVLVSSDSDDVLKLALNYSDVQAHKRSAKSSYDLASSHDYLSEILTNYPEDSTVVLLQPTSPLRESADIDRALTFHFESKKPVVSVFPNPNSPYWSFTLNMEGALSPLFPDALKLRSQELIPTFLLNGAIYIDLVSNYLAEGSFLGSNTLPYVMSHDSSIDIDTLEDFDIAEALMKQRIHKHS